MVFLMCLTCDPNSPSKAVYFHPCIDRRPALSKKNNTRNDNHNDNLIGVFAISVVSGSSTVKKNLFASSVGDFLIDFLIICSSSLWGNFSDWFDSYCLLFGRSFREVFEVF